ncbi:LexA family protein [Leucobacter sp. M11]|uniref:LexA family protein n=1 Tax=Leucobacter sp. M11 TaxID=2993565 RepID=UPI002D7F89E6|nr:S24 family peptidase [Leucobacter sp. M11]MEB4614014.1 LexA family transcriptional regulator [Leucobacter sp. M11]
MFEESEWAEGVLEQRDLNELLIHDRTATFILRVAGRSMENVGIFDGDHVLLDRSLDPHHGDVVVAVLNGELTLKTLDLGGEETVLRAESGIFPNIHLDEHTSFRVLGVVTTSLRHLRQKHAMTQTPPRV